MWTYFALRTYRVCIANTERSYSTLFVTLLPNHPQTTHKPPTVHRHTNLEIYAFIFRATRCAAYRHFRIKTTTWTCTSITCPISTDITAIKTSKTRNSIVCILFLSIASSLSPKSWILKPTPTTPTPLSPKHHLQQSPSQFTTHPHHPQPLIFHPPTLQIRCQYPTYGQPQTPMAEHQEPPMFDQLHCGDATI